MRHSPELAEPQRAPLALRRRSADTMSRKLQPIEPCAASENAARHGHSSPQDAQWCRRHPTLRCHSGQKATNAMLVQTETPFANAGVAIGVRIAQYFRQLGRASGRERWFQGV